MISSNTIQFKICNEPVGCRVGISSKGSSLTCTDNVSKINNNMAILKSNTNSCIKVSMEQTSGICLSNLDASSKMTQMESLILILKQKDSDQTVDEQLIDLPVTEAVCQGLWRKLSYSSSRVTVDASIQNCASS